MHDDDSDTEKREGGAQHRAQSTEHRAQGTGHSIEHRAQRMHRVQDKRGGESTVGQQTGSTEHQRAARR